MLKKLFFALLWKHLRATLIQRQMGTRKHWSSQEENGKIFSPCITERDGRRPPQTTNYELPPFLALRKENYRLVWTHLLFHRFPFPLPRTSQKRIGCGHCVRRIPEKYIHSINDWEHQPRNAIQRKHLKLHGKWQRELFLTQFYSCQDIICPERIHSGPKKHKTSFSSLSSSYTSI